MGLFDRFTKKKMDLLWNNMSFTQGITVEYIVKQVLSNRHLVGVFYIQGNGVNEEVPFEYGNLTDILSHNVSELYVQKIETATNDIDETDDRTYYRISV
jgi:hypothetical protein